MKSFLIAALSADGFIARDSSSTSMSWTSKADKEFFKERTKQAGVIIMGSKTFETIGKPLPGRTTIVYTKSGKTYPGVETTNKAPAKLLEELEQRGFSEVAICGGASIYTLFAQARCLEKMYITVEPVLFGKGVPLFSEKLNLPISLVATKQLAGGSVLLEYDINQNANIKNQR